MLTLTVQADGLALAMRRLVNTPEVPPQLVRLLPRKPLRGRVVDSQGRSIADALVMPTWGFGNGRLDWEARTDAEGRFQWFEAPAPARSSSTSGSGASGRSSTAKSPPGMEDLTLTLHRPQHLHGTVTDAETGRPIERFTLLSGGGPAFRVCPALGSR